MNKYKVKVSHVFSEVLDIEALNEEEAREKALATLKNEDYKSAAHYETTIPTEHWPVITEEKYNEMIAKFEAELKTQENKEESNIITPNIITP
jgi:hypothetical protein